MKAITVINHDSRAVIEISSSYLIRVHQPGKNRHVGCCDGGHDAAFDEGAAGQAAIRGSWGVVRVHGVLGSIHRVLA
jgi:hypothetical protein